MAPADLLSEVFVAPHQRAEISGSNQNLFRGALPGFYGSLRVAHPPVGRLRARPVDRPHRLPERRPEPGQHPGPTSAEDFRRAMGTYDASS